MPEKTEYGLGEWMPKPWGRTRVIYRDDRIEIVECEIKKGGYSSEHIHHRKHNEFRVISGWLRVATDINPARTIHIDADLRNINSGVVLLHDTMQEMIPAGTRHQFLALEDTRIIEIYTPAGGDPIDPADIERFTSGGLRK